MTITKRKPDFKRNLYEKEAWAKSELICGVDEVGRSSLVGPIVAAAVMLNPNAKHKLIKDSKILTPKERDKAYKWLIKNSSFAVGIMHHRIIDKDNIYYATLQAMKRAVTQLLVKQSKKPNIVLVDAMPINLDRSDIPVVYFSYGERQSVSIAAASIIAKVTRDNLMNRLDKLMPGYGFLSNKGYCTALHKQALFKEKELFLHRKKFITFLNNIESDI